MGNRKIRISAAMAAAIVAISPVATAPSASAQDTYSTLVFTGVDVAEDSWTIWSGGLHWFNKDWSKDGFLLRSLSVYGEYDYGGGPLGLTPIDGEYSIWELMVGYQFFRDGHRFAAYIGAESQDHELSPDDPANSVEGRETGFKVLGEITLNIAPRWQSNLKGSYSTAFDSYWSQVNLGYKIDDHVKVGPEGAFIGNEQSDIQRVGAFAEFTTTVAGHPVYLTISGGYQFADESDSTFGGGEGGYGNAGIAVAF